MRQLPGDRAVGRHDGPEQERAEDRVNADLLRDEGRDQQRRQRPGHGLRARAPSDVSPRVRRAAIGRTTRNMTAMNATRQHDATERAAERRARHADDDRQQAPGGHVVDRRAGQRRDAELGARQPAIGQDAREHGKRGDRHRDAHEQREREQAARRAGSARG